MPTNRNPSLLVVENASMTPSLIRFTISASSSNVCVPIFTSIMQGFEYPAVKSSITIRVQAAAWRVIQKKEFSSRPLKKNLQCLRIVHKICICGVKNINKKARGNATHVGMNSLGHCFASNGYTSISLGSPIFASLFPESLTNAAA